jgi:hypothetical protein
MEICRAIPWFSYVARCFAVSLVVLTLGAAPCFGVEITLQNDSFTGTGTVGCQPGFIQGEIAAARFTAAPQNYPFTLQKVQVLACLAGNQDVFLLKVWQDDGLSTEPGALLYEEAYTLTGSPSDLNEIDLSNENIVISAGSVRIGFEYVILIGNPPGFAHDLDGHVTPHPNFIYALSPVTGWFDSALLGVGGDWILRLVIETDAIPLIFADGFESGDTSAWSTTFP